MVKNLDNEMGEQAIRLECEEKPNETITTHFLQKFCNAIARFTAHFIVKIRSFHYHIYTYPEAVAEISAILGHKITYERISLEAFREQPLKRRDPFFAQHIFEVAQDHAAGLFSGTDEVIEKTTGHKPMGLEEFIRKHRSAFE